MILQELSSFVCERSERNDSELRLRFVGAYAPSGDRKRLRQGASAGGMGPTADVGFDATLLTQLGISSRTYPGFKIPERYREGRPIFESSAREPPHSRERASPSRFQLDRMSRAEVFRTC